MASMSSLLSVEPKTGQNVLDRSNRPINLGTLSSHMNGSFIKTVAMLLVVGLALAGCENMSPETTGVVAGGLAGTAAGGIANEAEARDSTAVAVRLGTGAAVVAVACVSAKHR